MSTLKEHFDALHIFREDVKNRKAYARSFYESQAFLVVDTHYEELLALLDDKARLDFVLARQAFITTDTGMANGQLYQLQSQNEDEEYVELSRFHLSPRAAIDEAMTRPAKKSGA